MSTEIGARIRRIRAGKDYKQEDMATELDITPGAYAKIERGETAPSASRLLQIAKILKVDVMAFFKEPEEFPAGKKILPGLNGIYLPGRLQHLSRKLIS